MFDCVNGVIYYIVFLVMCELGVEVICYVCELNGVNINLECGVIYVEIFKCKVLEYNVDVGIVYDGDGDCVMMVDYNGRVFDGDDIVYIIVC